MSWRDKLLNEIAATEETIEALELDLKELRAHRVQLKKKIYDGATGELRGYDNLLVLISDIRPSIQQWIELYNRQHGGGAQRTLAERAIVSGRLIRAIKNQGTNTSGGRFISLQTADRLLQACNLSHRISDLEVVVNGSVRPKVPDPPYQHFEEI
jgi:hypothetical protein